MKLQNLQEIPLWLYHIFCSQTFGSVPKNPPFTETWREALAERLMSEFMVSFRWSTAFVNRRYDTATAEFLNTFPVSMKVPCVGRNEEGRAATHQQERGNYEIRRRLL